MSWLACGRDRRRAVNTRRPPVPLPPEIAFGRYIPVYHSSRPAHPFGKSVRGRRRSSSFERGPVLELPALSRQRQPLSRPSRSDYPAPLDNASCFSSTVQDDDALILGIPPRSTTLHRPRHYGVRAYSPDGLLVGRSCGRARSPTAVSRSIVRTADLLQPALSPQHTTRAEYLPSNPGQNESGREEVPADDQQPVALVSAGRS